MGMHTWFFKNKTLYDQREELYNKLDSYENGIINLEIEQLNDQIDQIDEEGETEYHDLFRYGGRNDDGTYSYKIITSESECFKFLEDEKSLISFKMTVFDTDEKENEYRKYSYQKLKEFWNKYPDGVIYFG